MMRQQQNFKEILFKCREPTKIDQILEEHPDLDPALILDQCQNNVLHQLAYQNHLDIIKIFVHHTNKVYRKKCTGSKGLDKIYSKDFKQLILKWFNQKNNQGFTPLLYAAYCGNIQTIKYFHQEGANFSAETNTGLNVFHLAAQNDKVNTFLYFKDKIELNSLDANKNTPLHWAAYTNSQTVAEYILASPQCQIDKKDFQGQTPLHLATAQGNTRIVRRLLLKGANRYIKNDNNKTAYQIADQSNFKTLKKMISQNYSFSDFIKIYCNVKIEYRPKSRGLSIPLIFILCSMIAITSINVILSFTNEYALAFQIILFLLLFIDYFSLLIPYSKPVPQSYQTLLLNVRNMKVCFQCRRKKPKRSYHCERCNVCIPQYDHHCTWINNCVGKHNLARFIIFLVLLIMSLGFIGLTSSFGLVCIFIQDQTYYNYWFNFRFDSNRLSQIQQYCTIFLFLINGVFSLFVFPIITLLTVQLKNLFTNKTTFQRLKKKNIEVIPPQGQQKVRDKLKKGKKNSTTWKNIKTMCTSNDSFVSTLSQQLLDSNSDSRQQDKIIV